MTESIPTAKRPTQTLRHRLDAIRRRQRAAHHRAHEFTVRRLEARLVSRRVETKEHDG